jgi:hypothetical protein
MKAKDIELFQNLSQSRFGENYYDFHNDYNCIKIVFKDNCLILLFRAIVDGQMISIKFKKITFVTFDFEFIEEIKTLTIDNMYRGKCEVSGELVEFKGDCGYFYLEFYEGYRMEFWSNSIIIE